MNQLIEDAMIEEVMNLRDRHSKIWVTVDTGEERARVDYGHILDDGEYERAIGTISFDLNKKGEVQICREVHT